ncbi:MAG: hypothetical protein GDA45_07790 [Chromatiales bacterium]|nr:hypothetical protein [Chromatiales bacterium]
MWSYLRGKGHNGDAKSDSSLEDNVSDIDKGVKGLIRQGKHGTINENQKKQLEKLEETDSPKDNEPKDNEPKDNEPKDNEPKERVDPNYPEGPKAVPWP